MKIKSHETPDIIKEQIFRTCRRVAGLTVEKTTSGLVRDIEDPESRVGFSHNALREYIYAEYIIDKMFDTKRESIFRDSTLSDGVFIFLRDMLNENDIQTLKAKLQSFDKPRDFFFNIAWRILPNNKRKDIIDIMGNPPNFSELDLSNMDLSYRDLSGSDFSTTLLGGVNFKGSKLDKTKFINSILDHVAFDGASFSQADFSKSEISSIVVYDSSQKRILAIKDNEAFQWLYNKKAIIEDKTKINPLMRNTKYIIAYKILKKMARYNFVRTMNEMGLLRGLSTQDSANGRAFLNLLHKRGYFKFVRKAAKGGRGADVIQIEKKYRNDLKNLFEGKCPKDLEDFFIIDQN